VEVLGGIIARKESVTPPVIRTRWESRLGEIRRVVGRGQKEGGSEERKGRRLKGAKD